MTLSKSRGNMYHFIDSVWSPLKGECQHDCSYCYEKKIAHRWGRKLGTLRLDNKTLMDNLGEGNTIFVCHTNDMFANNVPCGWIHDIIVRCANHSKNTYLFQSKNPENMYQHIGGWLARKENPHIFCTTVETDKLDVYAGHSKAPAPLDRLFWIAKIKRDFPQVKTSITVEPVMKFSDIFADSIIQAKPDMVAIGADSKNSHLPEPTAEEIRSLIAKLYAKKVKVYIKGNLKRLVPETREGWL